MSRLAFMFASVLPMLALAIESQPDFEAAKVAAKQGGKDILVFFNGSDWSEPSQQFKQRIIVTADFDAAVRDRFVFLEIDRKEHEAEADKALAKKNGSLKCPVWNYPAFALADEKGKVFGVLSGLRDDNAAGFLPKLEPFCAARKIRDQKWQQAEKAVGSEQARLLGEGLTNISPKLIHDNYRDILDRIKKADPEDASGYYRRFTFDISGFAERTIEPLLRDKKQAEALQEIDKELRNPVLTVEQRQKLRGVRVHVFMRDNNTGEALKELKDIVALNPTNDMGLGAANYQKYIADPIDVPLRWLPHHTRTWWVEWHVDVSRALSAPGKYEIQFDRRDGDGLDVRDVSLRIGERVIAKAEDTGKNLFRITIPEGENSVGLQLVAQTKSGGWLSGSGEIVVKKSN